MSEKSPKGNNELAHVLRRVNTLMKHGEVQTESTIQAESIPQLTEVYDGEPLVLISRPAGEFPTLNEFVSGSPTGAVVVAAKVPDQTKKMEALLAEVTPLVQTAIKKAAQQKLVDVELHAKIEAEIMQTLRERLQPLVVNGKS